MFSVNIDKLIKMTPLEAESYAKAADSLENLLADKGNMLAVVGSGMSSFKLAACAFRPFRAYSRMARGTSRFCLLWRS